MSRNRPSKVAGDVAVPLVRGVGRRDLKPVTDVLYCPLAEVVLHCGGRPGKDCSRIVGRISCDELPTTREHFQRGQTLGWACNLNDPDDLGEIYTVCPRCGRDLVGLEVATAFNVLTHLVGTAKKRVDMSWTALARIR